MSQQVHLNPSDVPAHLRGTYKGQKFKVVPCLEVTIPGTAGLWSGGSRDQYSAIQLVDGQQALLPGQDRSPWNRSYADGKIPMLPGYGIVKHTIFAGRDLGLTFYIHPDNAAKLLPAPVTLTKTEWDILDITAGLISRARADERIRRGISRETWDHDSVGLMDRGLLTKSGAITPAGKNARQEHKTTFSRPGGL